MSLLKAVDGRLLLDRLRGTVDPSIAEALRDVADDDLTELALLVQRTAERRCPAVLEAAVARAGERLDSHQVVTVARWLPGAADIFMRTRATFMHEDVVDVDAQARSAVATVAPGEPLVVAADLVALDLPLMPLAADVGRRHPQGRLVVVVDPLDRFTGGEYRAEAGVIVLDLTDTDRDAVARRWSHELAHALDDELAASSIPEQERFAEHLAPFLLEHEPATVAKAAPYVALARGRRALPLPEGDVPTHDAFTLIAFYGLLQRVPA